MIVHLLVVQVGVVAVGYCGGGIWAGAPAPAPTAAHITDAHIAAVVTRELSETIHHDSELLGGDIQPDVALRALRLWGHEGTN